MSGHRRPGVKLEEYCWSDTLRSFPVQYTKKLLLRNQCSNRCNVTVIKPASLSGCFELSLAWYSGRGPDFRELSRAG